MIINDEILSKAIGRINELQNETIQQAQQIAGAQEYAKKQIELFKEAEKHRKQLSLCMSQDEITKQLKLAKELNTFSLPSTDEIASYKQIEKEIQLLKSLIQEQEALSKQFISA